jgi:anthranilate/para-aminobenzoate synthase component I
VTDRSAPAAPAAPAAHALPALSPLEAAARLAGRRGRVVLHSARGRWSFVAAEPGATLIARGRSVVELDGAGRPARRFTADPLDAAEAFLADHGCRREPRADAAPEPRAIGYLGYDLARVALHLPGGAALTHDGPDLWLAAFGAVARWSSGDAPDTAPPDIVGPDAAARAQLAEALSRPAPAVVPPSLGPLTPADDDAHHMARIERARDHLAAGDIDRVHLARRSVARIAAPGDALALYAALAETAPAPFGALLELDGAALLGAASERFLAEPPPDRDAGYAALLRATLPAARVVGSPRLRAMQLIDELEPVRRGPYGGAIGYFGTGGAFDLALATRIGVLAQGELRIWAGGDIVADSDATAALADTEREAAHWLAALARLA